MLLLRRELGCTVHLGGEGAARRTTKSGGKICILAQWHTQRKVGGGDHGDDAARGSRNGGDVVVCIRKNGKYHDGARRYDVDTCVIPNAVKKRENTNVARMKKKRDERKKEKR